MLLSIALLLGTPANIMAQAPTEFIVNSTADEADFDFVDEVCDSDPGPAQRCTLRAAVIQANASVGEQIIRLQPVVYRLSLAGTGEDNGLTGDLDLRGEVQIIGATAGRATSTIDAGGLGDRVFDVFNQVETVLQNVTITGGGLPSTPQPSTTFAGGGIRTIGRLTINDSVIRNNTAAQGGGITHNGGTLTIVRSTISNNTATSAVPPFSSLKNDGGGGIRAFGGVLRMRDSTVSNNSSQLDGGGIFLAPSTLDQPSSATAPRGGDAAMGALHRGYHTNKRHLADQWPCALQRRWLTRGRWRAG